MNEKTGLLPVSSHGDAHTRAEKKLEQRTTAFKVALTMLIWLVVIGSYAGYNQHCAMKQKNMAANDSANSMHSFYCVI